MAYGLDRGLFGVERAAAQQDLCRSCRRAGRFLPHFHPCSHRDRQRKRQEEAVLTLGTRCGARPYRRDVRGSDRLAVRFAARLASLRQDLIVPYLFAMAPAPQLQDYWPGGTDAHDRDFNVGGACADDISGICSNSGRPVGQQPGTLPTAPSITMPPPPPAAPPPVPSAVTPLPSPTYGVPPGIGTSDHE